MNRKQSILYEIHRAQVAKARELLPEGYECLAELAANPLPVGKQHMLCCFAVGFVKALAETFRSVGTKAGFNMHLRRIDKWVEQCRLQMIQHKFSAGEQKDFNNAVHNLGSYLDRFSDEKEDLFDYWSGMIAAADLCVFDAYNVCPAYTGKDARSRRMWKSLLSAVDTLTAEFEKLNNTTDTRGTAIYCAVYPWKRSEP